MRHTKNAHMHKAADESRCRVRAEIREDMVPIETKKMVAGTDFPGDLVYEGYMGKIQP